MQQFSIREHEIGQKLMPQSDLQVLLRKGIDLAKGGQAAQARQILSQVVRADPTNIQGWLWLSSVVSDPDKKKLCLQQVLKIEPENKSAQIGLARLQNRTGSPKPQPKTASPEFVSEQAGQAPSFTPTETTPRSSKIRRLKSRKAAPASSQPTSLKSFQILCPFCRQPISKTASTCPHCRLPLVVDCPVCDAPVEVEWPRCRSCGQSMGDFRRKKAYFAGLATAYQKKEQEHKALVTWQMVELIDPNFPDLYLRLGELQAAVGRTDVAISTLRRMLEETPGQVGASLALGRIYHQLHRWPEARSTYAEGLAANPESPELQFALGWLLMELGKLEAALPYLQQATRLDPDYGLAWFRLGQLSEALNNPRQAIQAYKQASKLLPADTVAGQTTRQRLDILNPALPEALTSGWSELVRQMVGPILICVSAALLDAGLRPWWIPWTGWLALLLATLGAFLWVSGTSVPRNPAIRSLVGEAGLSSEVLRFSVAAVGGFCWLLGLTIILYPLEQFMPPVPA